MPMTNDDRADRAFEAINLYKAECLGEAGETGQDDIADLLTDLMHLCARDGDLDFDKALETARGHFTEERRG